MRISATLLRIRAEMIGRISMVCLEVRFSTGA
jgi:hypothetical protein